MSVVWLAWVSFDDFLHEILSFSPKIVVIIIITIKTMTFYYVGTHNNKNILSQTKINPHSYDHKGSFFHPTHTQYAIIPLVEKSFTVFYFIFYSNLNLLWYTVMI